VFNVQLSVIPGRTTLPAVIPARAKHEPGIHPSACSAAKWIPGSTLARRPGMTTENETRSVAFLPSLFARHDEKSRTSQINRWESNPFTLGGNRPRTCPTRLLADNEIDLVVQPIEASNESID
jgi:hypothetical protein